MAKRMGRAQRKGLLKREQPFVITIPATRIKPSLPESERVMIQGVIDAFWEEDGELVLLDYKTDAVKSAEQLINRYRTQMEYYREALETVTGKKVREVCLYSFSLMQAVPVP